MITMKQIILVTILAFIFSFSVFAQSTNSLCAKIEITGGGVVQPGEPMSFTAKVTDTVENSTLQYEWTVSAGKIAGGQGETLISVDTTDLEGNNITATVRIKGLPKNCLNEASETGSVAMLPIGEPLDRFGKLPRDEIKARIQNLFVELGNNPNSLGFLHIAFGTNATNEEQRKHLQKILQAIDFLKYPKDRLIFAIGKSKSDEIILTTVWIVPPGAKFPYCDNCEITKGKDFKLIK
jgi:hypothetical protein